jgi:magnesium transporter
MPPQRPSSFAVAELFVPEIKELLADNDIKGIKALIRSISMVDLAEAWSKFSETEQSVLFPLLSAEDAASLFQELEPEEQEAVSRFFTGLPAKTAKLLSRVLAKGERGSLPDLSSYPPHSVGSWMHAQRVDITPNLTSTQALDRIRHATRLRSGGPDGYYVTDKNGKLVGWVSLRDLIAAPAKLKLSEYMHGVRLLRMEAGQDQEDAIHLFTKYQPSMAPVVDKEEKLVGYLRSEDILPLVQKEATEDIQKLGGIEASDEPYFSTPFQHMVRKRATWLCVLFVGETLTATAMAFFEHEIARAVVLALFIPLIISSGGNSGSQAATLIVRAMALKEISFGDWWKVMRREFMSGAVLGFILGAIGFLRIVIWSLFTDIYGPHYLLVALSVSLALFLVVLWGSLSGSLLPIVLKRLKLDPAVVSAPFVATLVDVTGLVIYFSVAMVILRGTLL